MVKVFEDQALQLAFSVGCTESWIQGCHSPSTNLFQSQSIRHLPYRSPSVKLITKSKTEPWINNMKNNYSVHFLTHAIYKKVTSSCKIYFHTCLYVRCFMFAGLVISVFSHKFEGVIIFGTLFLSVKASQRDYFHFYIFLRCTVNATIQPNTRYISEI